jgi:hypothetical protein
MEKPEVNVPAQCPCRKKRCPRFGDCAACRRHHGENPKQGLPYCQRKRGRAARMEAQKPDIPNPESPKDRDSSLAEE